MSMQRNDPFSWLGRTGAVGSGSKAQDVAARGVKVASHTRAMPKRGGGGGSTGVQAPDGQPNPAMVSPAKPAPVNTERAPGAATLASRAKSGAKAASASIEGNESGKYEALEKRTLRSLKGGGTEKELREGHNTGKSMKPGGGGRFAALKSKIAAKGNVRDPGAVAAAIGRKKFGAKQMAKWASAGKKRS